MVTTIGIDPHKATHTAVAIDDDETVLAEITIRADKDQTRKLIDWAQSVDGDGRVWAVEAATGLGHLLSQQLVSRGEPVVDVPPVLASRIRVLSSGKSNKNDPNDARSVAIAALRRESLAEVRREDDSSDPADVGEAAPRTHRATDPGGVSPPCDARCAASGRYGAPALGETSIPHAGRDPWPRRGR